MARLFDELWFAGRTRHAELEAPRARLRHVGAGPPRALHHAPGQFGGEVV